MTALQPPILNLKRLMISSGWPSDFRMSMTPGASCGSSVERSPAEMLPVHTTRRRDAAAAAAGVTAGRKTLLFASFVRSNDASDWLLSHGPRATGQWAARASGVTSRPRL